jgi:hypothetical protein
MAREGSHGIAAVRDAVITGIGTGEGGDRTLDSDELAALTGVEMGERSVR